MRVIVLRGSPRRRGNSDTLADHFVKGLKNQTDVEIHDFILNDMKIRPCQGCESCMISHDHKCVIDDDMHQIYSVFADADVVVWATPMYWGYMTAQMKIALDRMEALAMDPEKYWVGKHFVPILTYRHHYQSTVSFFERVQDYFRFKLTVLHFCTMDKETHADFLVSSKPEMLEESYQLGIKLGAP
ncbi:flavodoxin family protein [Candidatus Thorarchaeota archaeon]|nr:flavodoxin family protein [Candidatus Thorarchaeota archaeon]TFG97243.1 MAG: flavodoxin family protein [Candidatus Thorarchaeota archaeon]